MLAAAKHGPLRQGFGGVRDFCIGIRFVTGDGRKAKGGGRVVKNVAGYDLMKLLIGSYGTLAVITSASFKLFPAPRQTRTFLAEFGYLAGGAEVSRPGCTFAAFADVPGDRIARGAKDDAPGDGRLTRG